MRAGTAKARQRLIGLLADLEEEAVLALVQKRIARGDDPLEIIEDCNQGMRLVGRRYERGEFFVSGLIMSGEIFRRVVELVQPLLRRKRQRRPAGSVLLGTVSGDIHDIGKNIAGMLLACHGFTVIDLGVDVPPDRFASRALELQPDAVGLSGLITASFDAMRSTVDALRSGCGARPGGLPIVIGGGLLDQQVCRYVGADHWVANAMDGVRLLQKLVARPRAASRNA
jgi:methanogenic corrinoid protein MtbC1